jgi:hypothetical protein
MALFSLAAALSGRGARGLLWLDRVAAGCIAILAFTLLTNWGHTSDLALAWPPGVEPTRLSYASPGIHLAFVALVALALSRLLGTERPPPGLAGVWATACAYTLCTLTVLAFTVDQFLVRYVVLEFVALATLLTLLRSLPAQDCLRAFPHLYLQFRLGDVLLLAAILLLQGLSETSAIDAMIQRGAAADLWQMLPIAIGASLAAWIKTGLPPFHNWLEKGIALPWRERIWVVALGLPILGAYLLYRVKPILAASGLLTPLAVVGALLLALSLGRALCARRADARQAWGLAAHSALGLILIGGAGMRAYLLSFVPWRAALCLALDRYAGRDEIAARPPYLDGAFIWLGKRAETVETRVLEPANASAVTLLWRLAGRVRDVVERGLDALNALVANMLWALAQHAHDTGETRLEALNAGFAEQGRSAAKRLHEWHEGQLRRNLLWAACALLALIVLILILR